MKKIYIIVLLLAVGVTFQSCKKYFDPPLVFEKDPGPGLKKARKVMLISIDGLSGIELEKYQPENIKALLEKSKYSFEGFSDANTTDASTWTSMMSGKASSKHGVFYEDFEDETEVDPDDPHGNEGNTSSTGYISVYQRLLESGKQLKSVSLTSWKPLAENLFALSDEFELVDSDESVKIKAIERLENKDENSSFFVVNFRALIDAGKNGGFSLENNKYKEQLDIIDGYLGEILHTLKSRQSYDSEDWMVIVTSNHGGRDNNYGGGSMEERTIPVIYYNEKFVGHQFKAPPSTVGFESRNGHLLQVPTSDAVAYNMNGTDEYTIQIKMMQHAVGSNNAAIISKQGNTGNPDNGWSFIHNGPTNGWRLKVGGGHSVSSVIDFELEKWYTLTAIVYRKDGKRHAITMTDDKVGGDAEVNGNGENTNQPLRIGFAPSWSNNSAKHTIRDFKIYKKALPVEHIQETYCQNIALNDDLYAQDLIGFWPIDDGIGKKAKNHVLNAPDAVVTASENWKFYSNNFCKSPIDEDSQLNEKFIFDVDILPQIFYWLQIETHDSWDLEGEVFLNAFEKEFITE